MPPEAPVRNGVLERVDNVKKGRGRPKLTWDESVKIDLKIQHRITLPGEKHSTM